MADYNIAVLCILLSSFYKAFRQNEHICKEVEDIEWNPTNPDEYIVLENTEKKIAKCNTIDVCLHQTNSSINVSLEKISSDIYKVHLRFPALTMREFEEYEGIYTLKRIGFQQDTQPIIFQCILRKFSIEDGPAKEIPKFSFTFLLCFLIMIIIVFVLVQTMEVIFRHQLRSRL